MEDEEIPDEGAVFTFGKTRFANNEPSRFWIKSDPIRKVACGDEHSALITESGRLFSFGANEWGQCGHGNTKTYTKPTSVKALKGKVVTHVACGRSHTITATGEGVKGFGNNAEGQLGLEEVSSALAPTPIPGLEAAEVADLAAGADHSLLLNASGAVIGWGSNREGQLGLDEVESQHAPTIIANLPEIAHISSGYYHSVFTSREGEIWVCGEGEGGKLGLGNEENQKRPALIDSIPAKCTAAKSGANHTVVLTEAGRVYVFGSGQEGQLGLGEDTHLAVSPLLISQLERFKIVAIACGFAHTLFITDSGLLYACGSRDFGKLGPQDEENKPQSTPQSFPGSEHLYIIQGACGGNHTITVAKKADASIIVQRQATYDKESKEECLEANEKAEGTPLKSEEQTEEPIKDNKEVIEENQRQARTFRKQETMKVKEEEELDTNAVNAQEEEDLDANAGNNQEDLTQDEPEKDKEEEVEDEENAEEDEEEIIQTKKKKGKLNPKRFTSWVGKKMHKNKASNESKSRDEEEEKLTKKNSFKKTSDSQESNEEEEDKEIPKLNTGDLEDCEVTKEEEEDDKDEENEETKEIDASNGKPDKPTVDKKRESVKAKLSRLSRSNTKTGSSSDQGHLKSKACTLL